MRTIYRESHVCRKICDSASTEWLIAFFVITDKIFWTFSMEYTRCDSNVPEMKKIYSN